MAFKLTNSPFPTKAERQARRAARRKKRKGGSNETVDAPISHIAGGPNAGYWQVNSEGVKVRVPNPNPGSSKAQTNE